MHYLFMNSSINDLIFKTLIYREIKVSLNKEYKKETLQKLSRISNLGKKRYLSHFCRVYRLN